MPIGATAANDWLKLIFQAVAIADLAENDTSSPAADLYLSLHTADPGAAGTQATNEVSYTGYARVPIPRSVVGWTVTNNAVSPAADITFDQNTGAAAGNAVYGMVGVAASGAGKQLVRGQLSINIPLGPNAIPIIRAGSTITIPTT